MSKRTISLVLTICMIFSCAVTALAVEPEKDERQPVAVTVNDAETAEQAPLVSLDQLSERAQQLHRDLDLAVRQTRNAALATAAAKSVLLSQYGGAMVVSSAAL